MTVTMVDCIAADIPAVVAVPKLAGLPVAGYVTGGGDIEWSERQFSLFARKIRIAQWPGLSVDEASAARVLDVERYAATPDDWPLFHLSRDDQADETCYCSLWTVPDVIAACKREGVSEPSRWWLAWYWRRPGQPTAFQVLTELRTLTGVELDPDTLWAAQYANYAQWDLSVVYGVPDFARA